MKSKIQYVGVVLLSVIFTACSHIQFQKLQPTDNKYNLSTEESLLNKEYTRKIDSLYDTGVDGYFNGANNVKIYYKYFIQDSLEKGAIVISDGRTEAVVKYKEVIYDLFNNGYSVYIHDHRGQGFSGRMLPDPDMGYVDEFQNYIDDMKYFYDNFVKKNDHKNIYLLAHSMGGAIGATYLEEYPNDFTAAALSSPMLGFSFPTCLVIGILTGDEPEYGRGQKGYEESIDSFNVNTLTGSKIRFERMIKIFDEFPKARLGGATYQWVNKSCNQFDIIFDNIFEIKTPLILFSADNEEIVSPSAHKDFIEELKSEGKEAEGFTVEGAKHELLIEKDKCRIPVLTKILDFYSEHRN